MNRTSTESSKDNSIGVYASKLLIKYPDSVPVIFDCSPGSPPMDKKKYVIPRDLLVSQLVHIVRKKIKLSPEKSIFVYFNKNYMASSNMLLSEVYENFKDKDGILYVTYSIENTFG